jgi:hypothetical protein
MRFAELGLFRLSLDVHEGRPSYMRIPQPSKENIQHLKILNY